MTRTHRLALISSLLVVALGAPAAASTRASTVAASGTTTIKLVTHDSFSVSKKVLQTFTSQTGIAVKVLAGGDAGEVVSKAILTKGKPLGDVLFGVDNTFLSRALDARIFRPYTSPALAKVPMELQLDASHNVTPIDQGDVCINYDKTWFSRRGIAVPTTLDDLTKPDYKGLLVVENPATSSPGLAFLLASIAKYGNSGWRDYWQRLRANAVTVVDGWEQAYNGSFTQGEGKGDRPLVVSYASSPSAAVYYGDPRPSTSPIGTMLASCFRQIEFAGILAGSEHVREARRLIDFMLSAQFQADVPLSMFVFPVREGTPLPSVFSKFAEVAPQPLTLPSTEIGRNREQWISEWTQTVLR